MMGRRSRRSGLESNRWIAVAVISGMAVGLAGWSAQQRRSTRRLFSPHPMHRLAALGYLRAHPSVDSARLLRDYLRWEPHALLRRHARKVLRRTERLLRS